MASAKEEYKGDQRRVFEIRDEEDEYAIAALCKEEEAVEKGRLAEEAEREAQRIEWEINSVVSCQLDNSCKLGINMS